MRQIVFMENGQTTVATHEQLYAVNPAYRSLYDGQMGGGAHEAE